MKLASLDLNLLVALDALLSQRSVTRAAEQMGLSQPALSASLARLRRHFDDQLLVRVGNEYRPTPLAVQLTGRTRTALAGVERVFLSAAEFDPASTEREFSLVTSDYWTAVHGVDVVRLLAVEAPRARVRLTSALPSLVDAAAQVLTSHDLMLIPHGFLSDLHFQDLYRDEWVFLVATENPDVGDVLTADELATMPWVVAFHGPTAATPATRQLRMLGVEPTVAVVSESFLILPALVAGTRRLGLVQRRLVDAYPGLLAGVREVGCEIALDPMTEAMWWHPVYDEDPAHRWLRDAVVRATGADPVEAGRAGRA